MLFTIAIGVFNGEAYIGECLESLAKEKCNNQIEILVIDDGSTDKTVEIAHTYAKKYSNVRVVEKGTNRGLGDNYNVAIKEAIGDYMFFMDGDDIIDVRLLLATIENTKLSADILSFRHYKFTDKDERVYDDRPLGVEEGIEYRFEDEQSKVSHFIHDLVYNRKFLLEHRIEADNYYKLYNDMAFNMRVFQKAQTVQFFKENIYGYRFSDVQSMSINSLIKWRMDRINMSKSMIGLYFTLKEEKNSRVDLARRQAAGSFADAYMGMLFGDNVKSEIYAMPFS